MLLFNNFNLWKVDWVLGYILNQFWDFPDIQKQSRGGFL